MTTAQDSSEKDRVWIEETRFGKWFLDTDIWMRYVLAVAIRDLKALSADDALNRNRMLDLGCGAGAAFKLLSETFKPKELIGVDIDSNQLDCATSLAAANFVPTKLMRCSAVAMDIPDRSADVVFCHQLIHHLSQQREVLQEIRRVLRPGGVLLLAESCAPFIESWTVRFLFRHPPGVQKSARDYVALVREAGFVVNENRIQESTPWWSLNDFGLGRRLGWRRKPHETTELLLVATKRG